MEDAIDTYIVQNMEGNCLLVTGDETVYRVRFHTDAPWKVLEYAVSLGEIHDVIIKNMERQSRGLTG